MGTTPLAGYPYPPNTNAPAAAADLMKLALAVDDKTTLTAVDAADRNDRFGDAKVGTLVVSGASQAVWMKIGNGSGDNDWLTIYSDTGKVTQGFTAAGDFTVGAFAWGRIKNGLAEVALELFNGGDDIVANSAGNVTPDVDLATIPPAFAEKIEANCVLGYARAGTTSGTVQVYPSGTIRLMDMHANSTVSGGGDGYLRVFAHWFVD